MTAIGKFGNVDVLISALEEKGLVRELAEPDLVALSGDTASFLAGAGAPTTLTVQEPASEKYFPSDEPYRLGAEYFNRGDYGLAERYFRDAVEKAPGDAIAH